MIKEILFVVEYLSYTITCCVCYCIFDAMHICCHFIEIYAYVFCSVTYFVMYFNLLQMLDYNVPGGVAWEFIFSLCWVIY